MINYTEKMLNKIAYANGEKRVDGSGVTVSDGNKIYRFGLVPVANAMGIPYGENVEMGVALRMLDLGKKKSL